MNLIGLSFPTWIISALLALFVHNGIASQIPKETDKTIKIGLLIQDSKYTQARNGAEIAIRKANEKGGIKGRSFQLITRSMEGSWGTGSKEAVNLIFKEGVCAILGSHDGRNAHLVEQVTAKAQVVFVSAWASDPTLSQAFVPWFFNTVPNDLQQAEAIMNEIYTKRGISKIAAVSDDGYDSKLALKSFLKKVKSAGKTDPYQFSYDNSLTDFSALLNQISKADVNGIVLLGKPGASGKLIQQLRIRNMNQQVFGSLSLLGEDENSEEDLRKFEGVVLVSYANYLTSDRLAFQNEFLKNYHQMPGDAAAFAFDGMNLIIEALQKYGTDREAVQKALAGIHFKGVTGSIQFDDRGNRVGAASLIEIKNGLPIALGK
ncbi:MAG: ABC transporter substrate-binding protein [Mariniphaga sp.]